MSICCNYDFCDSMLVSDVCWRVSCIQFCAEYFGQHNSYDVKHNVEPCEHNDKLQEIQNSIMRENMSILSSGLPVHIDQCGCITLTASVRPKGHSPQGRCLQNQQGSHFLGSWSIMRVRWPPWGRKAVRDLFASTRRPYWNLYALHPLCGAYIVYLNLVA